MAPDERKMSDSNPRIVENDDKNKSRTISVRAALEGVLA